VRDAASSSACRLCSTSASIRCRGSPEILNGVEHANFFETRATEYAKAATGGDWHGPEGAWGVFDARLARQKQSELLR